MPVIVVGGTGRGAGKTALVCGLIEALPEFRWTAVKITAHEHGKAEAIYEEIGPSSESGVDTVRFLAAGAQRALLLTVSGNGLPVVELRQAIGDDSNVIFESNQIGELEAFRPDLCLAVVSGSLSAAKPSFRALEERADAFFASATQDRIDFHAPRSKPLFAEDDLRHLSGESIAWIRSRV